ncbi:hypothetical protein [Paenibacillus xylanexedens]|nr:hypothetical protein [Paenibacillus xylanexedens]
MVMMGCYFENLGGEAEEGGRMDGCGEVGVNGGYMEGKGEHYN